MENAKKTLKHWLLASDIDGTINNANQAIQALKKAISEEVGMDVPVPKIQKWDEY